MKTPDSPTKLRAGHSSNEGRKKHPRIRIEAALKQHADTGLTRHELAAATDCSVTLINDTIGTMKRANAVHHDKSKPAVRFFLGPAPAVEPAPDVVRCCVIDIWALPVYRPAPWNVREGAGRVRA